MRADRRLEARLIGCRLDRRRRQSRHGRRPAAGTPGDGSSADTTGEDQENGQTGNRCTENARSDRARRCAAARPARGPDRPGDGARRKPPARRDGPGPSKMPPRPASGKPRAAAGPRGPHRSPPSVLPPQVGPARIQWFGAPAPVGQGPRFTSHSEVVLGSGALHETVLPARARAGRVAPAPVAAQDLARRYGSNRSPRQRARSRPRGSRSLSRSMCGTTSAARTSRRAGPLRALVRAHALPGTENLGPGAIGADLAAGGFQRHDEPDRTNYLRSCRRTA